MLITVNRYAHCITHIFSKGLKYDLDVHFREYSFYENSSFPVAICGCHHMATSWNQCHQRNSARTHTRCH